MKLVITGDTHIPGRGQRLPHRLIQECTDADLIIHTGDFRSSDILEELQTYADVKAVYGNVDEEPIRNQIPSQLVFEANGIRFGLVHGHGDKKTTEQRALDTFADEPLDVIIFGHSHLPVMKYVNGIMLLNPGSPTDKRKLPFYSFIILDIDKELHPRFVMYRDKS